MIGSQILEDRFSCRIGGLGIQTGTNLDDSNNTGGWDNLQQMSFGLNYRPVEATNP